MDNKLAAELIKQNDNLREQLKQANKQIQELENEITVLKNVNNSI
jgi:conjugal transfer/entry exclusion protein